VDAFVHTDFVNEGVHLQFVCVFLEVANIGKEIAFHIAFHECGFECDYIGNICCTEGGEQFGLILTVCHGDHRVDYIHIRVGFLKGNCHSENFIGERPDIQDGLFASSGGLCSRRFSGSSGSAASTEHKAHDH